MDLSFNFKDQKKIKIDTQIHTKKLNFELKFIKFAKKTKKIEK